jgi:hypothetical protein
MFAEFDSKIFKGEMKEENVKLEWSEVIMTFAGKVYKGKMRNSGKRSITLRLSKDQLKNRDQLHVKATLLYHMIHCWVLLTQDP